MGWTTHRGNSNRIVQNRMSKIERVVWASKGKNSPKPKEAPKGTIDRLKLIQQKLLQVEDIYFVQPGTRE